MGQGFAFMQNGLNAESSFGHGPDGVAARLSGAQLAMLIEGLDWRQAIVHDEIAKPTIA
jgi:hypothetical protein